MLRSILVLPDGSEISSGVDHVPAIQYVEYDWNINPANNLDFEAASSATIKVSLIDTSGNASVPSGTEVTYYTQDSQTGVRRLRGIFIVNNPSKPSKHTYAFNAYDRMSLFDVDVTEWLVGLDGWPYSINSLLESLCNYCGVAIDPAVQLINGDYTVMQFLGHMTGRQLLRWVAGANAAYAYITPEGTLSFRDFSDTVALELPKKKATYSDFVTRPIQRVVVQQSETDIGVSWPEDTEGETYNVVGNPLLATSTVEELQPYVQRLADKLVGMSYTPAKLQLFDAEWICEPGIVYEVEDIDKRGYTIYAFAVHYKNGIATITSTGTENRTDPVSTNFENNLGAVQGRMAQVEASIERVSAELTTTKMTVDTVQESMAAVSIESNKVALRVSEVERNTSTSLESLEDRVNNVSKSLETKVDASSVSLQIQTELQDGVSKIQTSTGYTFDEKGLVVSKSSSEMRTQITEDGMSVLKNDTETLKASSSGVDAKNLRAVTYLIVGDRSRFENFGSDYTGCFWIGEV